MRTATYIVSVRILAVVLRTSRCPRMGMNSEGYLLPTRLESWRFLGPRHHFEYPPAAILFLFAAFPLPQRGDTSAHPVFPCPPKAGHPRSFLVVPSLPHLLRCSESNIGTLKSEVFQTQKTTKGLVEFEVKFFPSHNRKLTSIGKVFHLNQTFFTLFDCKNVKNQLFFCDLKQEACC